MRKGGRGAEGKEGFWLFNTPNSPLPPPHTHTHTTQELTFANGQSRVSLNITIINDSLPEDDEEFCVCLNLPEGGAILGNITRSRLTLYSQVIHSRTIRAHFVHLSSPLFPHSLYLIPSVCDYHSER